MPAPALLRFVSPVGRERVVCGGCFSHRALQLPHLSGIFQTSDPVVARKVLRGALTRWHGPNLEALLNYATEAVFIVLSVPEPGFIVLYLSSSMAGDEGGRANNPKCFSASFCVGGRVSCAHASTAVFRN